MIKTDRKSPKPDKKVSMEDLIADQQKEIEKQSIIIESLMTTMDDIILNGMGGM